MDVVASFTPAACPRFNEAGDVGRQTPAAESEAGVVADSERPHRPDSADHDQIADSEAEILSINFHWSVEQEIALFEAMMGHKPVGISKNIHMMCIHRKLTTKWINNDNKNAAITPGHIWAKLESMFDLEALDNSECVPFPDDKHDFTLPVDEFGSLMHCYPASNSGRSSRSSTVDCDGDEDLPGSNVAREATPTRQDLLPATPISIPATPATATPTTTPTTKHGRKRSKALNNSENANDRTSLSGPSSAKRSKKK